MQRYERYKDSGIEWLGEIPSHWRTLKMKYAFAERNTKGFPNEPLLSATQMYGVIPQSLYENRTVVATKGLNTLKLVKIGDFIISLRSFQGGIEYAYYRGIISPAYTVLEPKQINKYYFKYLGKSNIYIQLLKSCVTGIREGQNIDYNVLKENYLPIPDLREQSAIARFLDEKCEQIDRAVAQKERVIELLNERRQIVIQRAVTRGLNPDTPLRDSGIDWIGQIPAHWINIKTLFCLSMPITDGPHETPELLDDGIPFISAEAVSKNYIDFDSKRGYISKAYYEECCKKYVPRLYDIYMIKSGATTGRTAIVLTDEIFTIWSPLAVFRANKEKIEPTFLLSVLRSNYYLKQVENKWTFGTQQNIGMRVLENLRILLPPLAEQEEIAAYLDTVNQKIDRAVALKREEIEKLKEYKQTLINSAVTGKIKIA